jgi:hypothetical protein
MRISSALSALYGISLAASALLSIPNAVHAGPADSAWIQLFNKADTNIRNNWDLKVRGSALNVDTRRTWRYAINGADTSLEVNYTGYTNFSNAPDAGGSAQETFGHAAYKFRPFSYYILRSEYQVWGTQATGGPSWAVQNNGFMLHSQSMASMGVNQNFPVSMEIQLLGPANGSSTMNLCTPGTSFFNAATGGTRNDTHCTNSSGGPTRAAANTGWQSVAVRMFGGDSGIHYSGGVQVFKWYRSVHYNGDNQVVSFLSGSGYPKTAGAALTEGYITIQGESAPYRFRKIELLNLAGCMTVTDANYKSYLLKHDSTACAGTSGIKGTSPSEARYFLPMHVVGNAVKIAGEGLVTLEVFDMSGVRVARHSAQAPFQWAPAVKQSGMHVVRAITPKGTYTEKIALF